MGAFIAQWKFGALYQRHWMPVATLGLVDKIKFFSLLVQGELY